MALSADDDERSHALHVTIVADNPETLDGLLEYFRRSGVGAHGTRDLGAAERLACASAAIVLFPDDFQYDDVVEALHRLRRVQSGIVSILVTAEPRRFEEVASARSDSHAAVIIPKPAWGWTILDAVRGQLAG